MMLVGEPGMGLRPAPRLFVSAPHKETAVPHLPPMRDEGEIATPSHRPSRFSGERGRLARSACRFMAAFGFAASRAFAFTRQQNGRPIGTAAEFAEVRAGGCAIPRSQVVFCVHAVWGRDRTLHKRCWGSRVPYVIAQGGCRSAPPLPRHPLAQAANRVGGFSIYRVDLLFH
jgi:hypothetical protein